MRFVLIAGICMLVFSCSLFNKQSVSRQPGIVTAVIVDTTKKKDSSVPAIKPYKEVITAKAVTDSGLLILHRIDNKFFVEIPFTAFNKDMLAVTRLAKAAANHRTFGRFFGYSGDQASNEIVFFFEKGLYNKLFIKRRMYAERSADSSENGLYHSLKKSDLQPIVFAFDIKAYSKDSSAVVIDFTDILNGDNILFSLEKGRLLLNAFQPDKSYTVAAQSYDSNVEFQTIKTFSSTGTNTTTFELNTSIVLLPGKLMEKRYFDRRVGYFANGYIDFDSPEGVTQKYIINRWRLEPKAADREKYLRGELVEPQKPIVYYIDPATPEKWVPYLIQGVNDWQQAFEKAGFKNAIYALRAPVNDPDFSLFDARHNAIIYKPSAVPNASGPHIHDPRTGEILETHINWYHNVINLLHDWYMIQAGPNDEQARKMVFDDQLMGQLIRFVSSHEVGHTLGLAHNFGASNTVPVDSLRSRTYVRKHGFCPSIMDYARFNYVAQPEDSMLQRDLFPRIGIYDEWAIEWGYRWLPHLDTYEKQKKYMDEWTSEKLKNKQLWYGMQQMAVNDPRAQTEDLGDNAMKANAYGIENLKRVMLHLKEWTKEPHGDYSGLARMNLQVLGQYGRYLVHVINYLDLGTYTLKSESQEGSIFGYVPRSQKKEAVAFLNKYLFETPHWLMDKEIFEVSGGYWQNTSVLLYYHMLNFLFNRFDASNGLGSFERMTLSSQIAPEKDRYSFDEMLTDFETGIFKELAEKRKVDYHRRMLQKVYTERLTQMVSLGPDPLDPDNPVALGANTLKIKYDFFPIVKRHASALVNKIDKALPYSKDTETIWHLRELRERLQNVLHPNNVFIAGNLPKAANPANTAIAGRMMLERILQQFNTPPVRRHQGCWNDEFTDIFK